MNYSEFRNTYKWMLKKYYNISNIWGHDLQADCIIENYIKIGKKWILQETKTDNNISNEYYYNTIDAIPFFRNIGGYEGITTKCTKYGVIPYKINSISPDRTQKTIRTFIFK